MFAVSFDFEPSVRGVVSSAAILVASSALAAVIARALVAASSAAPPAPANDPRWNAPPGPPQFAGRACLFCARRIVLQREACACRRCGAPLHFGCADVHAVRVHRPRSRAAYR